MQLILIILLRFMGTPIHAAVVPGEGLNNTLTLGYLLSWSHEWVAGPYIGSAIVVAIREVQKRQLLPGYQIKWLLEDTWCQSAQGVKALTRIWSRAEDLDGIIGGGCSVVCLPVSLLAAAWRLPVISYGCVSEALSNKHTYPTFSRVVGMSVQASDILYSLTTLFNWNRVGVIINSVELFLSMGYAFDARMQAAGKETFLYTMQSTVGGSQQEDNIQKLRIILHQLKSSCRVICLFTYALDAQNLLLLAQEEDMLKGYVYIGPNNEPQLDVSNYTTNIGFDIYEGIIDIEETVSLSDEWNLFRQDIIDSFQSPIFDDWEHIGPDAPVDFVGSYAGLIHDAVLLWAYGVNKTLEQGYPPDDGVIVTKNIINLSFKGITGDIVIDKYGNRKTNYGITMFQHGKTLTILDYIAAEGRLVKRYKAENADDWEGLIWPGNQTTVPGDTPTCGWNNKLCSTPDKSAGVTIATATTIVVTLIIAALFASFIISKYRYEKHLKEVPSCLLTWTDIETQNEFASSLTSGSKASENDIKCFSFCTLVRYKSEVAVVKRLGSLPVNVTERKVLIELQQMRDLHHNNINKCIGVCLESPNTCVLMAYASHGSLHDVLSNDESTLTQDFKISFITDIANGMKYLHSVLPGWHGHLTSKNCVVDSRWVCKVTDYGLHYVRHYSTSSSQIDNQSADDLLWTAPELLRANKGPAEGTKKGDVYSYGIICQEIILQLPPYGENENESASAIIHAVKQGFINPCRPHIPQGSCLTGWSDLMGKCWQEDPELRPNFSKIVAFIKDMNQGKELSLVDSMIEHLEYHSSKLENIVAQRSAELMQENEKMEHLLMELLPRSIVEKLTYGKRVEPENFDNVTIFFSDIVGFTRISAAGSPIDVVKMLNLIYTLFDDISAKFDVYKVATIGDAYFVASGVPIRNGDRHAVEICSMALELLTVVSRLPVPHLPNETLQMRIGIHSGPCLAGVVGIKMPRYLLFGETVDIASKMESTGMAMAIQISEVTSSLLFEKCVNVDLKQREEFSIKGIESLKTYWLSSR